MDIKQIIVYNYDCGEFKQYVRNIASKKLNKESSHELLDNIQKEIVRISNEVLQSSCVQQYNCKLLGRGATSVCYQSIDNVGQKQIYKEFSPNTFRYQPICIQNLSTANIIEFNWLSNSESQEQSWRFLKRFIKFVLQSDEIDFAKQKANERYQNLYIYPKLMLSSIGFIYQSQCFFGNTLDFFFKQHNGNRITEISQKVTLVKMVAQYVKKICHDNNIYHGDIKPSNFFAIGDKKKDDSEIRGIDLIQNIDFDTWVHPVDSGNNCSNAVLTDWDMEATTPLYYYNNTNNVKPNQTFDTLQAYDVKAISRMLMHAILYAFDKGDDVFEAFANDSIGFDWVDYFLEKSGCGETLFSELIINKDKKNSIGALYIFESIKSLILSCNARVKRSSRILTIEKLIEKLDGIENLLVALGSGNVPKKLDGSGIRYIGLKCLDAERGNKTLQHCEYSELMAQGLSRNWVQYVIEQNYYKLTPNDHDTIDRHLIPDIDLGGGKLLAYAFDEKGNPISQSPLEQALEAVGDQSLFLTAEGGQGKTTMLRSFWLDFLSGRHNIPCVYIDSKMLIGVDNAIYEYIKGKYEYCVDKNSDLKPILLIDCPNESNVNFRKKVNGKDCKLVDECKTFIRNGYKIVIGSRADTIAINEKKDGSERNELENKREFDSGMKYLTVCGLRNNQIEHVLHETTFSTIKNKQPMINLLRNNMMLHIFMNLRQYEIELSQEDMKAGILIDKYFDVCFRTRYIKSCIQSTKTDREIYNEIKDLMRDDENDDDIIYANNRYDLIIKFLIDHCSEKEIGISELNTYNLQNAANKIYFSTFENLSILKKNGADKYIWADELYQEYFLALHLRNTYVKVHDNIEVQYIDSILAEYLSYKWNSLQFAGELLGENIVYYEKIVDNIRNVFRDVLSSAHILSDVMALSVLSCNEIPKNITVIEANAFSYCDNLISLKVHQYITRIKTWYGLWPDSFPFIGCRNLNHIYVDENNPRYHSCGNCLIETQKKVLILGCKSSIIPDDDSVKTIGDSAFGGCQELSEITIPNTVRFISDNAFYGCNKLSSMILPDTVESIGNGAFADCLSLSTIKFSKNLKKIGDDGWGLLHNKVFSNCVSLTDITIPHSVHEIQPGIFDGCINITNITVEEGNTRYFSKDNCLIDRLTKTIIAGCKNSIIPSDGSVEAIGDESFARCIGLTRVEIPNGVKRIYQDAFRECINLTSIIIPRSVVGSDLIWIPAGHDDRGRPMAARVRADDYDESGIDADAFYGCSGLVSIVVEDGNPKYHSDGNCLIETKAQTLVLGCQTSNIPENGSVTCIGARAFAGNKNVTQIRLPKDIICVDPSAFDNCNLRVVMMSHLLHSKCIQEKNSEWFSNAEVLFID